MFKHVAHNYSNYCVVKGNPFRGQSYSCMDIVVGIATRCGLDSSKPRWDDISGPIRTVPEIHPPCGTVGTGFVFQG